MTVTADDLIVIALIGILILAFVVIAVRENRRQKKYFLLKIRREWGSVHTNSASTNFTCFRPRLTETKGTHL